MIIRKKEEAVKNLNEEEDKLLSKILERGKYATTQDLDIENIEQVLKSLEFNKLIIPFEKATLGYIANIKFFLGEEHSF